MLRDNFKWYNPEIQIASTVAIQVSFLTKNCWNLLSYSLFPTFWKFFVKGSCDNAKVAEFPSITFFRRSIHSVNEYCS